MKIKLVMTIAALNIGGAERQFLEIVKKIDRRRFAITVVTVRAGTLDHEIASDPDVRLVNLDKRGQFDIGFLFRFVALLNTLQPDVVYSFLFDMNVWAAICTGVARRRPRLIWGIFGSEPDFSKGPRYIRTLFYMQRWLERRADLITSDSIEGLAFFRRHGFRLTNSMAIFSGTDVQRFRRHEDMRTAFRGRYALQPTDIAIGVCSRLVHMKGYDSLARVARRLLNEYPNVRFFSVGYGDDTIREECIRLLGETAPRFEWLGQQQRPETCLSGWDIYCSPSVYGEGFSNSIIEAMASELPCVATNVGDARIQLGDTGIIVEPKDDEELYRALTQMIAARDRATRGQAARQRVLENFTAERMVDRTAAAIEQLVAGESTSAGADAAAGDLVSIAKGEGQRGSHRS